MVRLMQMNRAPTGDANGQRVGALGGGDSHLADNVKLTP
jgi:hypothetical protein